MNDPELQVSPRKPTRDSAMDLLRIASCLGIIVLHESGLMAISSLSWSTYQSFVRPCLWVFALLSGYFILSRPIGSMKEFYLKKVSVIVIPLIVYSLIYQFWAGRHSFDSLSSFFGIFSFQAILTDSVAGHLWFVYSLVGVYLIAPFLQKLFEAIDDRQFLGLLGLMFLFTAGPDYLRIFGIEQGFTMPLSGILLFYFVVGYAVSRFDIQRYSKTIIILGFVNIPLMVLMLRWNILVPNLFTSSINMLVSTLFYYTLARKLPAISSVRFQLMAAAVSKRTYSIYLVHFLILTQMIAWQILPLTPTNYLFMPLVTSICIFILSYLASLVIDFLTVKPLMKLWNRVFLSR